MLHSFNRTVKHVGITVIVPLIILLQLSTLPSLSDAAPCLTNPTDPGGGVLGATVGTFIGLGVNPSAVCIENALWTDPTGFNLGAYMKGADGMGGSPDPTILAFNGKWHIRWQCQRP